MATVYVLYSESINRYYIGSCQNFDQRLKEHKNNKFTDGFTRRASDWEVHYKVDNLEYQQARKIEHHIKGMKSRKYIKNLLAHPEIIDRLKKQYS